MIDDKLETRFAGTQQVQEFLTDFVENVIGSPTTTDVHLVAVVTDEDGSVTVTSTKTDEVDGIKGDWEISEASFKPIKGVNKQWQENLYGRLSETLMGIQADAVPEHERISQRDNPEDDESSDNDDSDDE